TASPDAEIAVTINGGNAAYTYQVSFNGGGLSASTNVAGTTFTHIVSNAGTYRFTITDAIGCTVVTNLVTVNPLPVLNPPVLVQTAFNRCNGDSNAAISVTPSGGQGPYIINVVNTTTSNNYGTQTSGLTAGDYTVTVTDANSCIATANITLTEPDPIDFLSPPTNIQCGASGTEPGTITVTNVTGGTLPFTYIATNSTGTFTETYNAVSNEDYIFNILNFGVYTITLVDANGCQSVHTNIRIASPPNSLTIDIAPATIDCTAGGTVDVTVSTGSGPSGGPYYFAIYEELPVPPNPSPYPLISFTGTTPNPPYQDANPLGSLTSTFTGLIPGVTYSFIVYDAATNLFFPFPSPPSPQ
uniref:PKD domain-containing protein n=1 Tax=Flavobacterium sp. TaxID=239 RepID=UPI0040484091